MSIIGSSGEDWPAGNGRAEPRASRLPEARNRRRETSCDDVIGRGGILPSALRRINSGSLRFAGPAEGTQFWRRRALAGRNDRGGWGQAGRWLRRGSAARPDRLVQVSERRGGRP